MSPSPVSCVYGAPPIALAETSAEAVQVSPLVPGAADFADLAPESLDEAVIAAPAGTLERRYVLAQALTRLRPGGALTALAPKDRGGARLARELAEFGVTSEELGRRHHRICRAIRPQSLKGVEAALSAGGPTLRTELDLWTQPGVFSWDRVDPGTALLIGALPPLSGRGADFGCGVGVIARHVLKSPAVADLELLDIDRRALDAARRNVPDARARFRWADIRGASSADGLDFVVCNPPFHAAGVENHGLGVAFIQRASAALRRGGVLWIVANRHLPYEAMLAEAFSGVARRADAGGYKVYEARR